VRRAYVNTNFVSFKPFLPSTGDILLTEQIDLAGVTVNLYSLVRRCSFHLLEVYLTKNKHKEELAENSE
jgi:hypothetical protein